MILMYPHFPAHSLKGLAATRALAIKRSERLGPKNCQVVRRKYLPTVLLEPFRQGQIGSSLESWQVL